MMSVSAKSSMSPSEGSDISTSESETSSILGWDILVIARGDCLRLVVGLVVGFI